jgi:hypothetical protein
MNVTRLSPSRRREDIRTWWAEHLQAHRNSGQSAQARRPARNSHRRPSPQRYLHTPLGSSPAGVLANQAIEAEFTSNTAL